MGGNAVSTAAVTGVVLFFCIVAVIAVLLRLEKLFPVEPDQPRAEVICNYKMVALNVIANQLLKPVAGFCAATLVSAAGGGFIELRADGWRFASSLIVLVLTIEVFSYLIHRLQHAVPALWAMHSLHHSAESLTVLVGARHYWLEGVAVVAFLPFVELLFKTSPELLFVIAILYFLPDQCAHLNIRFSLGPFAVFINHPQYHRIHHSVLPQHRDKNFCKLLPVIDVLLGTAWIPGPDEFPPTGLASRDKPATVVDGVLWPIRRSDTRNRGMG